MKPNIVGHRILVSPITLEEHDPAVAAAKKAGIVLADKTERQEASIISSGTVVQMGATTHNDGGENWCKEGDRIDYVRHGGMFVTDPDNKESKWYVINDEDVLVVWSKE